MADPVLADRSGQLQDRGRSAGGVEAAVWQSHMRAADTLRRFLVAALAAISTFGGVTPAQPTVYPKPTELPNPYRLVEGWPSLPKNMNGGKWGEVIRVHLDAK